MARILVSGLINVETTLAVDGFPIDYSPVRYPFFGISTTVSGVGYNIARALTTLGDEVFFQSIMGQDLYAPVIRSALNAIGVTDRWVIEGMPATAQSVILFDPTGRRHINTDLKDIQQRAYPADRFETALGQCELAVLCNINFSRPFLAKAKAAHIPVATDVHTIASLDDDYNRDFMAAADILFMSDEKLPLPPVEWARAVQSRFNTPIIVIGMGRQGALLAVTADDYLSVRPAVVTRPVVNTIGAGDALFSSFLHFYAQSRDPYEALGKAQVFASYKIGESGGAEGFLDEAGVAHWKRQARP